MEASGERSLALMQVVYIRRPLESLGRHAAAIAQDSPAAACEQAARILSSIDRLTMFPIWLRKAGRPKTQNWRRHAPRLLSSTAPNRRASLSCGCRMARNVTLNPLWPKVYSDTHHEPPSGIDGFQ